MISLNTNCPTVPRDGGKPPGVRAYRRGSRPASGGTFHLSNNSRNREAHRVCGGVEGNAQGTQGWIAKYVATNGLRSQGKPSGTSCASRYQARPAKQFYRNAGERIQSLGISTAKATQGPLFGNTERVNGDRGVSSTLVFSIPSPKLSSRGVKTARGFFVRPNLRQQIDGDFSNTFHARAA